MSSKGTKNIITDAETLKDLIYEVHSPSLKKISRTLILGNLGIILAMSWGIITDHFVVKNLVSITSIHSTQIDGLNNRTTSNEKALAADDARIKNIENNRKR